MLRRRYIALLTIALLATYSLNAQQVEKINDSWKFILEDQPQAAQPSFDDSEWRSLDLPHDWAFEQGYSEQGAQGDRGGYLCGGIGWYRKQIDVSAKKLEGKQVFIDFEGVYMNSEVWVNGEYLGKREYGYVSFSYDITKLLKSGKNIISVRVDNSLEPSARWYHGCGIYGSVRLSFLNPTHFEQWSTFITTPEITKESAKVNITSKIAGPADNSIRVCYQITDPNGTIVGRSESGADAQINIDAPKLWSDRTPNLYKLRATIVKGRHELDAIEIPFGIRSLEWRAETGFWLNGENVKLRGVCEHLEGGPVGAAWSEDLMLWKLQILKDMGCNAIRTAHNPQLPMFYDICDRLGIMVMDEAFDGWSKKADFDYGMQSFAKCWRKDLSDFIRRDRNHPSVVIYSVGNETKGAVSKELVELCHKEDPTRAVTSGHSGSDDMDVLGINGHSERKSFFSTYAPARQAFIGTETPHTWQVRGFYRTQTWYRDGYPNKKQEPFQTPDLTTEEIFGYHWLAPEKLANAKQIFNSSYDNGFVRINARQNMEFLRDKPWYAGHFRWTGFDYLGEAGYVHGGWPFRAFMGGVVDMAGFPKDHYYLYQSQWTDKDMIHILPHWTHPYMEPGTKIPVWVYTTADQVELLLNGKSLGRKSKGTAWNQMQCEWLVEWTPGVIEAVAYKNGREVCRAKQTTSGSPSKLAMSSNTDNLERDQVAIVTIEQQDAQGTLYPYGENRVWFSINGDARIISLENGNPVDTECNVDAQYKRTFFGLLRAFVKPAANSKDISLLTAAINGDKALKISDKITIDVRQVALRGNLKQRNIEVYYTTDGTQPTKSSTPYGSPFGVGPGTTVKAAVYDKEQLLFTMEERFGTGEGLYWGAPGAERATARGGEQAERATLTNAKIMTADNGAEFVRIKPSGGSIGWYQENDGSRRTANITFHYAQQVAGTKTTMELLNNGKVQRTVEFPNINDNIIVWGDITFKIELFSGANQIELRSTEGGGGVPDIDYMNITD